MRDVRIWRLGFDHWKVGRDGAVVKTVNANGLTAKKTSVYTPKASKPSYNDSNDVVLGDGDGYGYGDGDGDSAEKKSARKDKKRKTEDVEEGEAKLGATKCEEIQEGQEEERQKFKNGQKIKMRL